VRRECGQLHAPEWLSALPGTRTPGVIPKVDNWLSLTRSPQISVQDEAVTVFFKSMAYIPSGQETLPGHFQFLETIYNASQPDSATRLATTAAALGALSKGPLGAGLQKLALSAYGSSLQAVGRAIKDERYNRSDELVQAILMLLFFEVRSCHFDQPGRNADDVPAVPHHVTRRSDRMVKSY